MTLDKKLERVIRKLPTVKIKGIATAGDASPHYREYITPDQAVDAIGGYLRKVWLRKTKKR